MQKKNTNIKAVSSSNSRKADPLDKYRAQARTFIDLYFGDDTPPFVRDLLSEWYSQLENQTQVFWNDRRIAEIAVPLMLKKAAAMGIDVENMRTDFMTDVVGSWGSYNTLRNEQDEETGNPAERNVLREELAKDAEAIAQLLSSPHVPFVMKAELSDRVAEYTARFTHHPDVLKVSYNLGITEHQAEQAN